MNYEEWLKIIDDISRVNDRDKLLLLINEEKNPNICDRLQVNIENLVYLKIDKVVKKVHRDLADMFKDSNYLDMVLVNFKKEINYILDICEIKQLSMESKNKLINKVKDETGKVFDILILEADKLDMSGILGMTIKNNMIKWGE